MKRLSSLILLIFMLVSCSTALKTPPRPTWVDGTQYMADAIQGVGVAPKMMNPAAQRQRAEHQARLAIAQTMRTKVAGFIRDWINENQDYFTNAGESLSYFEATSEELTSATLVGVQIPDHWTEPREGTMYALAVMSKTEAVQNLMDEMKKLSSEQTQIIKERADEAFNKLEEKLEKANW